VLPRPTHPDEFLPNSDAGSSRLKRVRHDPERCAATRWVEMSVVRQHVQPGSPSPAIPEPLWRRHPGQSHHTLFDMPRRYPPALNGYVSTLNMCFAIRPLITHCNDRFRISCKPQTWRTPPAGMKRLFPPAHQRRRRHSSRQPLCWTAHPRWCSPAMRRRLAPNLVGQLCT
jgi:hypothetical protein